jgi:hypothetical protein
MPIPSGDGAGVMDAILFIVAHTSTAGPGGLAGEAGVRRAPDATLPRFRPTRPGPRLRARAGAGLRPAGTRPGVPPASGCGLLGRRGAGGFRPRGGGASTLLRSFAGRRAGRLLPTAGAALLSAARHLVFSGPGAPLRLVFRYAAALVALLDVPGSPLLLCGVGRLVSARHGASPGLRSTAKVRPREARCREGGHI